MKQDDKKLIFTFAMLVIIILASFATATYYYEGRYLTKEKEEEVSPLEIMVIADKITGSAPHEVSFKTHVWSQTGNVNYSWDFGDGNTSDEPNPTHIYAKVGEYNCTLTVIDNEGRKISENIAIKVVQNKPPKVEIFVSPTIDRRPMKVQFDAEAYDDDGEIVSYNWVITHPPMIMGLIRPETKVNEEDFTKTFWRTGQYDVSLTVEDDSGNRVTKNIRLICQTSMIELIIAAPITIYTMMQGYYTSVKQAIEFAISNGLWERLYNKFKDAGMESLVNRMDKILDRFDIDWKPGMEVNDPPITPSEPSPTDNATGVDVNANISWNCTDPDGDTLIYDVYFGKISPPPLASDDQNTTTFDPGKLEDNTTYYWRIVAFDGRGGSTSSPIWRFKTKTA